MAADDKKLFCVLKDPVAMIEQRDGDKNDVHTLLYTSRYAKDGSRQVIQSDLDYALAEFIMNMAEEGTGFQRMEEAPRYSYCMNSAEGFMDSFFLIWYATAKLRKDQPALEAFWKWLEEVAVGWAYAQELKIEVLRDKPGAYWRKFIITIPVELLNPKHTEM